MLGTLAALRATGIPERLMLHLLGPAALAIGAAGALEAAGGRAAGAGRGPRC